MRNCSYKLTNFWAPLSKSHLRKGHVTLSIVGVKGRSFHNLCNSLIPPIPPQAEPERLVRWDLADSLGLLVLRVVWVGQAQLVSVDRGVSLGHRASVAPDLPDSQDLADSPEQLEPLEVKEELDQLASRGHWATQVCNLLI